MDVSTNTSQPALLKSYHYKWLGVVLLIVLLDQISKGFAESWLLQGQPYPVMPSFNLTLWYNTGAAFSLLSEAGGMAAMVFRYSDGGRVRYSLVLTQKVKARRARCDYVGYWHSDDNGRCFG